MEGTVRNDTNGVGRVAVRAERTAGPGENCIAVAVAHREMVALSAYVLVVPSVLNHVGVRSSRMQARYGLSFVLADFDSLWRVSLVMTA